MTTAHWLAYFLAQMDADAREYEERCRREEERKLERLEYRDLHGR